MFLSSRTRKLVSRLYFNVDLFRIEKPYLLYVHMYGATNFWPPFDCYWLTMDTISNLIPYQIQLTPDAIIDLTYESWFI